jgi:thiamine pyrophosphokinase
MTAAILTSGGMPPLKTALECISQADITICADGAANWAYQNGITPDILIGDMDSIQPHVLEALKTRCETVYLEVKKDDTDTHAAAKLAKAKGADTAVIIGGTGGRLDHAMANINVLAWLEASGISARMEGSMETVRIVKDKLIFDAESGTYFSVFPFENGTLISCRNGVEYPLERHRIDSRSTLTVSNRVTTPQAEIIVHKGTAIVMIVRKESI